MRSINFINIIKILDIMLVNELLIKLTLLWMVL